MSSPLPLLGRTVLALLLVVGLPQFALIVVILIVFIIYTQRHRF